MAISCSRDEAITYSSLILIGLAFYLAIWVEIISYFDGGPALFVNICAPMCIVFSVASLIPVVWRLKVTGLGFLSHLLVVLVILALSISALIPRAEIIQTFHHSNANEVIADFNSRTATVAAVAGGGVGLAAILKGADVAIPYLKAKKRKNEILDVLEMQENPLFDFTALKAKRPEYNGIVKEIVLRRVDVSDDDIGEHQISSQGMTHRFHPGGWEGYPFSRLREIMEHGGPGLKLNVKCRGKNMQLVVDHLKVETELSGEKKIFTLENERLNHDSDEKKNATLIPLQEGKHFIAQSPAKIRPFEIAAQQP